MTSKRAKILGLISAMITLYLIMTANSFAAAGPPPPGYMSWQVRHTATPSEIGDVPMRRGYYDDVTDRGFGTDKIREKHGISDLGIPWLVLEYGRRETATDDDNGQYTGQVRMRLDLQTTNCIGDLGCGVPITHKMIAVVEDNEREYYWVALASVKPTEQNPGVHPTFPNSNEIDYLRLVGADYESDERIVGLVTCYEEGVDGHVSQSIKDFDVAGYWDTMFA
ncbi:hypothetical protein [Gordonia sp. KTR9]|uniref:hypothetical protein n=1 Tax=Gordonia sp. KTR9 TaxID=337191 RepID=UPI0011D23616|nr:hypothetical protein [Gordonia sp. KTR9]